MADLKTQKNDGDVTAFLESIADETKRRDSFELVETMERLSGEEAAMWGDSIVGFGSYPYRTSDGVWHEWFKVGFSPRKQNLTLYIMTGFARFDDQLGRLGKHTTGKSCLYVRRLDDVDRKVLAEMIADSVAAVDKRTSDRGLIE